MIKLSAGFLLVCFSCLAHAAETAPLVVATYDSLAEKFAPQLAALYEKKCSCKVKVLSVGEAGQLVARMQLDAERGRHGFQIALGLDSYAFERAKPWVESWGTWKPANYKQLQAETVIGDGFLPFDYGVLAFIADGEQLRREKMQPPRRLRDLLESRYRRKFILEDPRTSAPGLGFLMYTQGALPDFQPFWSAFAGQWLTLPSSWTASYSLFLKGEAPFVWSYTTSQAYHAEHGDVSGRYQAVLFDEGNPIHVDGAVLVRGALKTQEERARAFAFLDFLLSDEVQKLVPHGNWMLPAIKGTKLPESFAKLPKPMKILRTSVDARKVKETIDSWSRAVNGVSGGAR